MPESPFGSALGSSRKAADSPLPRIRRIFLRLYIAVTSCGEVAYQLMLVYGDRSSAYRCVPMADLPVRMSQAGGIGSRCRQPGTTRRGGRCAPTPATTGVGWLESARDVLIEYGPVRLTRGDRPAGGNRDRHPLPAVPGPPDADPRGILDALQRTIEEARQAAEGNPTRSGPWPATCPGPSTCARRRHPRLLAEAPFNNEEIGRARLAGPATAQALVDAAHRAGGLRPDVTAGA